jgi:hypothetical protein
MGRGKLREVNVMELFFAQNHSAMTHLPIAASILAAVAAVTGLFVKKREVFLVWAILSLAALATVPPALITGVAAARGRFNEEGKPYIQSGLIVDQTAANDRIFKHQAVGAAGTILAGFLAVAAIAQLRGRKLNRLAIALFAILLAILWGVGGHLGGEELWSPETFPAFQSRAS